MPKRKRTAATLAKAIEPLVFDIRPIFARGESPCGRIDQAVSTLKSGQDLVLLAPFEPVPLFTKLNAQGFDHQSEPLPDGSWKIRFARVRRASRSAHTSCGCS